MQGMFHVGRNQCRLSWRPTIVRKFIASSPTSLSKICNHSYSQNPNSEKRLSSDTTLIRVNGKELSPEDAVNPPRSTLPPALELPTRDPAAPAYKYYFKLGRAYAGFYKTGFKQIFRNIKLSRELPVGPFAPKLQMHKALSDDAITRGQYHLLLRVRSDISRLPLFALVFMCCGEFTPLFVPFLGPVVPKTFWLPSQWEKARRKAVERRQNSKMSRKERKTAGLSESQYDIGSKLNAWPRWLEVLSVGGVISPLLFKRMTRKVDELHVDDAAIQRNGGIDALSDEELRLAADTRGLDVMGKGLEELKGKLAKSMEKNEKVWGTLER